MLSRDAQEFADEIKSHYWSDAHKRRDRAGHRPEDDTQGKRVPEDELLTAGETNALRFNVMVVTLQVLKYRDPNLDIHEYALACGVDAHDGEVQYGLRNLGGALDSPGRKLLTDA